MSLVKIRLLFLFLVLLLVNTTTGNAEEGASEEPAAPETVSESAESESAEDDSEETEKKADQPKLETHRVERKPLRISVKLKGVFVAEQSEEVALRPEVWKEFTVEEAVDHGTRVKKGDVLVRFDAEKIEKQLAEESIKQRLGELALMELEEELPRKQRQLEIAYEQAQLAYEQLVEDIEYYKNTDRPFMVQLAKHRLKSSQEDLASQEEELAQLEKMYAADDLTEETEEIVLRRQKFQVEAARLYLNLQQASHDYTLDVQLPRTDESYTRRLEQAELKLIEAKTAKQLGITRGKYQLEEKRNARVNSIQRHSQLLSDKEWMVIRAPEDGIVYYGNCEDGKLSDVGSLESKLKPHGSITPGTVLMTILKQRPLHVLTSVDEEDYPDMKVGLAAKVAPAGDEDTTLAAKVSQVIAVPNGKTQFAIELSLEQSELPDWLVAGMTCSGKVTVYEKSEALVIPCNKFQTDADDEQTHYVMLVRDGKEPERRDVKLGRSDGKVVEVLGGLSEGDEIVEEKKLKEAS